MTKARDPSTFEDAILRIVDRIGWAAAADAVGKGERVVRNWSDPDMDRQPTIDEALLLDAAYLAAGGGEPPPMVAVYLTRLDRRQAPAADSAEIATATAVAAKEAGEAVAAAVAASQPGADKRIRAVADKEIGDAIGALQALQTKVGVPVTVQ